MHERQLLVRLVEMVESRLLHTPDVRAISLRVQVSPSSHLHGHDHRALNEVFRLVALGTRAEGAMLEITTVPLNGRCHECGREEGMESLVGTCDRCGAKMVVVKEPPEVVLHEIVLEETDVCPQHEEHR